MTTHRPFRTAPDRTAAPEQAITNMHDVLSDPERRFLLHVLQEAEGPVPLADLAARRRERDGDAGQGDLAARLRDEHVVPMAEFGIVAYDRAADAARLPDDVVVSVPAEDL